MILLSIVMILLASSLVLVFNARFFYNTSLKTNQLLYKSTNIRFHKKPSLLMILIKKLGQELKQILPQSFIEDLSIKFHKLNKNDELEIHLSISFLSFLLCFLVFIFKPNLTSLICLILTQVIIHFNINYQVEKLNNEIEANIEHLIKCLKVLLIQSETPIINALSLIAQDLSPECKYTKRELRALVNKAQKLGLKKALANWHTELAWYRDLISLLISVNNGSSKLAIQQNIDSFLEKIKEEKEEKEKASTENLQLMFMGPVVLMLLVSMYPMMDAIQFLMQNSGLTK